MEDGWFQWEDHWYYLHTEYDASGAICIQLARDWREMVLFPHRSGRRHAWSYDDRCKGRPDGFYVGEDGAGFSNVEGLELVKQAEEALLWQRKVHKGASSLFLVIKRRLFFGKSS